MQMSMLRDVIGKSGKKPFEGYGDLSLAELLPAVLTRYSETELLIAAPSFPDQAAEAVMKWMKRQWARADGRGKLDVIRHLTIVADLSEEKSPMASQWLKDNPFGDRLTLAAMQQPDTAILLPDFAITGPVNMRYGEHFTAMATAVPQELSALWQQFKALASSAVAPASREETEEAPREEPVRGERRKPAARRGKDKEASGILDDADHTVI